MIPVNIRSVGISSLSAIGHIRPSRTQASKVQTAPSVKAPSVKERAKTEQLDIEQHTAILEMGVAIWNQWRVSEPFTIPNLQNADLSGLALENVNLAKANLRGTKLDRAYLYDADFQGADLRGASLNHAVLIGTNFCKANLSDACLAHAYLAQSDLSSSNLTGATLTESDLRLALMAKATLANARIANADMTESSGLTPLQVESAKDAHLALLPADLKYLPEASCLHPKEATKERQEEKAILEQTASNQDSQKQGSSVALSPASSSIVPKVVQALDPSFRRLAV